MNEMIHAESHVDHGIGIGNISAVLDALREEIMQCLPGIYRKTHSLASLLEKGVDLRGCDLRCALYGPLVGDAPISEDLVYYAIRGDRKHPSRMIRMASRPIDVITVIVGLHNGLPTLYTMYAGPLAEREPIPESAPDSPERLFWREHALAAD